MKEITTAFKLMFLLAFLCIATSFSIMEIPRKAPLANVYFYKAILHGDTINKYYRSPQFNRFVFQPFQEDAEARHDYYSLLCYAVDVNNRVMNNGNAIPLRIVTDNPFRVFKKLILSQYVLDTASLNRYYRTSTASMRLEPQQYKPQGNVTDYIRFRAVELSADLQEVTEEKVKSFTSFSLDPSPPAPVYTSPETLLQRATQENN